MDLVESHRKKYLQNGIELITISERDNGIYDAINKGIMLSNDGIVGILNSDDVYFSKDSICLIVDGFVRSMADIIYSNLKLYDKKLIRLKRSIISKPFTNGLFEKSWTPPHPTFYTYKSNYLKYGLYSTKYKIAGDGELMFRFLEIHKLKSFFLNLDIVKMRMGGISTNSLKSTYLISKETFDFFKYHKIKFSLIKYLFFKVLKIKELISFRL
jgi:hypothetical protein